MVTLSPPLPGPHSRGHLPQPGWSLFFLCLLLWSPHSPWELSLEGKSLMSPSLEGEGTFKGLHALEDQR